MRTALGLAAVAVVLVAVLAGLFAWWWSSNANYLGHRRAVSDAKNAVTAEQQAASRDAVCIVLDAVPGHNPIIQRAKNQPYPLFGKGTQHFCTETSPL